jgi:hypothetical protein
MTPRARAAAPHIDDILVIACPFDRLRSIVSAACSLCDVFRTGQRARYLIVPTQPRRFHRLQDRQRSLVKGIRKFHNWLSIVQGPRETPMPEDGLRNPDNDIFVSYADADSGRVKVLVGALEAEGWKVFWDKEILPGEEWESAIGIHLDAAPVVIGVWSELSVKSRFVRAEVNRASKRNVLIPVAIDSVEPPFGFDYIQAADLVDWMAHGGGKLPGLLKRSIERKVSGNASNLADARTSTASPARPFDNPRLSSRPQPQSSPAAFQASRPAQTTQRSSFVIGGLLILALIGGTLAVVAGNGSREEQPKNPPPLAAATTSASPTLAGTQPAYAATGLVGTWRNGSFVYSFFGNGTYVYEGAIGGTGLQTKSTEKGTYSVAGDELSVQRQSGALWSSNGYQQDLGPETTKFRWRLVNSQTGTGLQLVYPNGGVQTFYKQ